MVLRYAKKTIFTKEKWTITNELTFPRFINLTRREYENKYYIANVIYEDSKDPIIYASHLLRKYKLNKLKLNESK